MECQESAAQRGLRGEADRVHDAVETVHIGPHVAGEARQMLRVGDVQLDHRYLDRKAPGDPLDERHPAKAGQDHPRALLLSQFRDVERESTAR
jgi:hypothetical protein